MLLYRSLREEEVCRELFHGFIRRQKVTKCWRRRAGQWVIRDDPFTDDWTEADYCELIHQLRLNISAGGFVFAAFWGGALKGFVSVEPVLFCQCYLDLTELHVSQDMRKQGIGKHLFLAAKQWARARGASKLYISAHSAVETQAFYQAMGCTDARVFSKIHTEKEPYDRQLECSVQ